MYAKVLPILAIFMSRPSLTPSDNKFISGGQVYTYTPNNNEYTHKKWG